MAENTEVIQFNVDDLTLGELCDLEDFTGITLDKINLNKPNAKTLTGLLWLFERRSNPKFTFEDARNVKVTALSEFKSKLGKSPSAV